MSALPHRISNAKEISLRIGGLTRLTTIDFPGELAAVVFCQGCPWRCRYCHNAELLDRDARAKIEWDSVLEFLERRIGLLDAVVFSGGEPTAQATLPEAARQVAAMGYRVGLHTAGSYPERLERLLPQVDWVGLDIKALPDDYPALTGVAQSGNRAWRSLQLLRAGNTPFAVRITQHPGLIDDQQLQELLAELAHNGIARPQVQACRTTHMLDATLETAPG
jgi:pyruvate formate lyase activating enzyme